MAVLLRASRARHCGPRRRPVPLVALPFSRPGFPKEPRLLGGWLALADGLLAVAEGLSFFFSGAWLLPAAAELVAHRPRPAG